MAFAGTTAPLFAQTNQPFDGTPWHVSTGNLSVMFIQASPVGAYPKTNFIEAPPSLDSQVHLKNLGLIGNEDYVAWARWNVNRGNGHGNSTTRWKNCFTRRD